MQLDRGRCIQIGRLGRFRFSAGRYVYIGSAWGPGGLNARLRRHLQSAKKRRWHIDYLRRWAKITEIWVCGCRPQAEHLWAAQIGRLGGAVVPAEKFGSSDCRCPAHLFHLPGPFSIRQFNKNLMGHHAGRQKAQLWKAFRSSAPA